MGGGRLGAQSQNAGGRLADLRIGGDQPLGVDLADGNVQRSLVLGHLTEAVQSQIEAFADADSGGAGEEQRVGGQIICSAQFPLQELVVFRGQRSGQILGQRRKVLAANQVGREGMSMGRQVLQ